MSSTEPVIAVVGATGQQGGATAAALFARGWRVRAVVRDPRGAAARQLARSGAALVTADLDHRASLETAFRGAHGVFSVQPALIPPDFAPNELQRGITVADAAQAVGVRHLVYSSVASRGATETGPDVPHWTLKREIEQHLRAIGIPTTVLRPVMFMENHADPTYGVHGEHSLLRALPADRRIQLVAAEDIGVFAALAFAEPDQYVGQAVELAGDELTPGRIAAAITRASGRDLTSLGGSAEPADDAALPRYQGWHADPRELRRRHPGLLDFDAWLTRRGKALLDKHFSDHERR
ncbi:NmrA/HSCARG family protein [Amycolatopsis rhabdoformis]|uniref:NmrA/HSCARG family protein n=1 Tax=Amycolatopsis rhabdoformis TaxID=1448059 RepID=A0ABZ1IHV2_9PSEU|nr:NmrA/HSCARG family protein [Amycolatopsis rhabdoformis]WSE33696.1 NmrA/HSCARG family protein [Amycolatopsis rhabdoformis]